MYQNNLVLIKINNYYGSLSHAVNTHTRSYCTTMEKSLGKQFKIKNK